MIQLQCRITLICMLRKIPSSLQRRVGWTSSIWESEKKFSFSRSLSYLKCKERRRKVSSRILSLELLFSRELLTVVGLRGDCRRRTSAFCGLWFQALSKDRLRNGVNSSTWLGIPHCSSEVSPTCLEWVTFSPRTRFLTTISGLWRTRHNTKVLIPRLLSGRFN